MSNATVSPVRKIFGAVVLIAIFAAAGYATLFGDDAKAPAAQEPLRQAPIHVTWDQLEAEYNQNTLAFEKKHQKDTFAMEGNVVSVQGSESYPSAQLRSPAGTVFMADFDSSQAQKMATLKQGDPIAFVCGSIEGGINMQGCALQ